MKLTSTITPYNPEWPAHYAATAEHVRHAFGGTEMAVHHVGSTAVEGLSAKPEIDVLIVVASLSAAEQAQPFFEQLGYQRGSDLSAGHAFFRRDVLGVRTHKLHVCVAGHVEIERMLYFRDKLRSDRVLRDAYQQLKLTLERINTAGIGEYIAGKAPFVARVLNYL